MSLTLHVVIGGTRGCGVPVGWVYECVHLFAASTDLDQGESRQPDSKCVCACEPGECRVCACTSDLQSLPTQEEEGTGTETTGTK